MRKYIIWGLILIVLAIGVYYGRYFVFDTEVSESSPQLVMDAENQTGEVGSNFQTTSIKGSFTEVDRVHKGEGRAILARSGDNRALRFENFRVTNGPDLYVYLSKEKQPTSAEESLGDFINLGKLKGNVGDQNYEFKATDFPGRNLDEYSTVVIWCKQFSQLFSFSNLD